MDHKCQSCPDGEYYSGTPGNCLSKRISQIPSYNTLSVCPDNCATCTNADTCQTCKSDFVLSDDNQCTCPEGTTLSPEGVCVKSKSNSGGQSSILFLI